MHAFLSDAAARIAARHAVDGVAVTAAGAGDATEVASDYVNRLGFSSLKVVISYTAVLAATKTLSIAANLESSTTGSGAGTDFGAALASAVVATGPAGGGTVSGVVELDFDITGADTYLRAMFTPDLSATSTDTAKLGAVYILSGAVKDPASGSLV